MWWSRVGEGGLVDPFYMGVCVCLFTAGWLGRGWCGAWARAVWAMLSGFVAMARRALGATQEELALIDLLVSRQRRDCLDVLATLGRATDAHNPGRDEVWAVSFGVKRGHVAMDVCTMDAARSAVGFDVLESRPPVSADELWVSLARAMAFPLLGRPRVPGRVLFKLGADVQGNVNVETVRQVGGRLLELGVQVDGQAVLDKKRAT